MFCIAEFFALERHLGSGSVRLVDEEWRDALG